MGGGSVNIWVDGDGGSDMLVGFPGGSVVKNPPANAGDRDSVSGLGRSSGGGNSNPLQYSYQDD